MLLKVFLLDQLANAHPGDPLRPLTDVMGMVDMDVKEDRRDISALRSPIGRQLMCQSISIL